MFMLDGAGEGAGDTRSTAGPGPGRESAGALPHVDGRRYRVGCAGQFFLNQDSGAPLHLTTDDLDEAFASCDSGPIGVEVYDSVTDHWLGPCSQEEIDEAKARLISRAAATTA